jgi:hypothetical protein
LIGNPRVAEAAPDAVQWATPCQWLHEETQMRAVFLRAFVWATLPLAFVAGSATVSRAQIPGPQSPGLPYQPVIATRLESLLATPNAVIVADYYRIDMRFGPSMRIDALVVEAVESRTRVKGLRVQVRDPENRRRPEGTSYIDIDELVGLSRGVATMAELAAKWTHDDRQATELFLTTAGGFQIAIRHSARVPRAYLSTGLIDPVVTWIEVSELPTLKQAFDEALAVLNRK